MELPSISWPEEPDLEPRKVVVDETVALLERRAAQHLAGGDYFFLASPVPGRRLDLLEAKLHDAAVLSRAKLHVFTFGLRGEGWGLAVRHSPELSAVLPLLFQHGAERLYLVAVRLTAQFKDAVAELPQVASAIVLGEANGNMDPPLHTGLEFECSDLVSGFSSSENHSSPPA